MLMALLLGLLEPCLIPKTPSEPLWPQSRVRKKTEPLSASSCLVCSINN